MGSRYGPANWREFYGVNGISHTVPRDRLHIYQTVANELAKLKLAYKKQLKAAEQHRPDIAEKRYVRKMIQLGSGSEKPTFLDETRTETKMIRWYGRAPVGVQVLQTLLLELRKLFTEKGCNAYFVRDDHNV